MIVTILRNRLFDMFENSLKESECDIGRMTNIQINMHG